MRNLIVLFIAGILLFSSCKKRRVPADILEPEKMQAVFWDYIRADVYARDFLKKGPGLAKNDTLENAKLQKKIFAYYNISREDFYKSYDYYTQHPDLMNVLMDSMLVKQEKLKPSPRLNERERLVPALKPNDP